MTSAETELPPATNGTANGTNGVNGTDGSHPEYAKADDGASALRVGQTVTLYGGRTAPCKLRIIIVGCGLGGLAAAFALQKAGHECVILEQAPAIGEVGAGIQVTPNVSRVLLSWGLGPQLERTAVIPQAIVFRRWETGERVGYTKWGDLMLRDHGAPYCHIHRADFHRMLYDLAVGAGVQIRLGCAVTAIDADKPSVTLRSGESLSGDLLIGADGVKSMIRQVIVGGPDAPVATGDAAYRATIPTSLMLREDDLRGFVENPEMTAWMGPGRHIMGYCIRGGKEYNVVLLHPDDGSVESWTAEGSADKMRADFEGWEPRIQKMLGLVPSTLKWKLMDRGPLETWIHKSGKVVLLGDSCHPMLPYRAQGAAMAVEDAAVLGSLLSHISSPAQIPFFLRAYQDLRHARCTDTQAQARLNQLIFHLPDGPEQQARDEDMRRAMEAELGGQALEAEGNQNQWADKKKSKKQFGYDAEAEAESWWREVGEKELREREATPAEEATKV
ncbi:FAD/NAD(P)-binding domain-containing protein [Calocera cornea HHB12733]|uniref:FAD/NAD(P)-binding domain-containing protein n=1 Tax=Calocera cornea HHB12733 TaxID=1353952 RepID=A0A165CMZ8_9BASI|nr:FAD/NAD(P)-binding domain-containing protein [Calocera cornea HHB12733]